ncbi:hypothetical protein GCM10027456_20020 [Kineosporia babensis]
MLRHLPPAALPGHAAGDHDAPLRGADLGLDPDYAECADRIGVFLQRADVGVRRGSTAEQSCGNGRNGDKKFRPVDE